MNFIFRLFLTSSALSLFISLFLVHKEIVFSEAIPDYVNYLIYTMIPFALSFFAIRLSKKLGDANLGRIKFVEATNNDFLSNYLAFFFVALSLNNWTTFFFCFGLTALFTFYSRVSYFNPILLMYGYTFYYVHLDNNSKVMLITRQKIKSPEDIRQQKCYKRINDYTFMEEL